MRRRADPRKRIELFLLGSLIILSLVAGRLVQLQGLDRTTYTEMAQRQRLHTVALSAARGQIVDRQSRPLAETVDARDVYADPRKVTDAAGEADQLAGLLPVDAGTLRQRLEQDTTFVYLARAVAPQLAARVMELKLPGTEQGPLPGIGVLPATKRIYPAGPLASNVVGFANADGEGLAG